MKEFGQLQVLLVDFVYLHATQVKYVYESFKNRKVAFA